MLVQIQSWAQSRKTKTILQKRIVFVLESQRLGFRRLCEAERCESPQKGDEPRAGVENT